MRLSTNLNYFYFENPTNTNLQLVQTRSCDTCTRVMMLMLSDAELHLVLDK